MLDMLHLNLSAQLGTLQEQQKKPHRDRTRPDHDKTWTVGLFSTFSEMVRSMLCSLPTREMVEIGIQQNAQIERRAKFRTTPYRALLSLATTCPSIRGNTVSNRRIVKYANYRLVKTVHRELFRCFVVFRSAILVHTNIVCPSHKEPQDLGYCTMRLRHFVEDHIAIATEGAVKLLVILSRKPTESEA